MLETHWRVMALGAASALVACQSDPIPITEDDPVETVDVQHDVTEQGVISHIRDVNDGVLSATVLSASPDWLEMKFRGERIYLPKGTHTDVSVFQFGRPDLTFPQRPTRVDVDVTGLAAWRPGDSLQLVSPNVGLAINGLETHFAALESGATAIRGQHLDWRSAYSPLISRGRGDATTWLAQMQHRTTPGGTAYNALALAGRATSFAVADGVPSTLTADLAPVAQDRSLAFTWHGTAFDALAEHSGPGARIAAGAMISVRALPAVLATNNHFFDMFYMYLPTLVDVGAAPTRGDIEHRFEYGNPFASGGEAWSELVTVVYAMPVAVPDVGGVNAIAVQAMPASALANGELAPAIYPVRNVRIDGKPLDTAQSIGTAATLTWDAPSVGRANSYRVAVQAILPNGPAFQAVRGATFRTTERSLALPAFALAGATQFIFTITAVASPGRDLVARPFMGSLPYASADYVTATVRKE